MDVLKGKFKFKLKKKDIRVTLVERSFEELLSYENFRIHVYQCFGFD